MRCVMTAAVTAGIAFLGLGQTAVAGEAEDAVIAALIKGYGGAKFETMTSVTITSDLRYGWLGQGQTAEYVDLEPMTKIYHIDYENERGAEEAWGGRGAYAERVITTNEGQKTINYIENTYSHDAEAGFYDHFGGEIRTSDTLLARDLLKHRESAKVVGMDYYWGAAHDLITYDMPGTSIDPVLWVNRETGYISKMRRDVEVYVINYVFGAFKQSGGVTYADDFILYVDNDIVEYAKSRSLKVNRVKSSEFEVPKSVKAEPETVARDKMRVDVVAGNTSLVGQNFGYSAFVDAGDYLVATGGYSGLKERYEAYTAKNGTKPLKYLIVTHHHLDHVEGIGEALALGASLVTHPSAVPNLNQVAGETIAEDRLWLINEEKATVGPVDVHIVHTPHAKDYALVYVPGSKTVFQADHYNGNFKDRASSVSHVAMGLKREIERLGLDVDYILSAHASKIETWSQFETMADAHIPGVCPTNRRICR